MIETISGIITAIAVIFISRIFSKYFTAGLFASTILVAIAFIYVGFSLKGNQAGSIILECTVAMGFYFLAIIGYTRNNFLIAFGIILHGVWDISHHGSVFVKTDIPGYWPSFCLIVDIIDGIYFLLVFKSQKKNKEITTGNE